MFRIKEDQGRLDLSLTSGPDKSLSLSVIFSSYADKHNYQYYGNESVDIEGIDVESLRDDPYEC